MIETNEARKRAHRSIEPERAEQPPVGRTASEGDTIALLPPRRPAVGADSRLRSIEEAARGAAAPADDLRRGIGPEGGNGVSEGGEGRGRLGGAGGGEGRRRGGLANGGLEAVDGSGGDLHLRYGSAFRILRSLERPLAGCAQRVGLLVLLAAEFSRLMT